MNEYEELHRWLDEQAENDISTEELLQEYGLTMEKASEQADLYRGKFFELLRKYEVCSDNISVMIAELDRLIYKNQNEDLLFIYTALATEKGLLFGDMEDEEQKILCWLEQSSNAEKFSKAIRMEKNYKKRLENTGELVRKVNASPKLKVIKPYVYSAVLSRKHKLMTDRKNYSPNFAVFSFFY